MSRRIRQMISRASAEKPALVPLPPANTSAEDDSGELAREMGQAFGEMVKFYRTHYGATHEEALQRAGEGADSYFERILSGPPDQVSWHCLDFVAQRDPDRAMSRWEEVKQAARDEVQTGHRSARALEGYGGGCWARARYLATRAALAEGFRPRSGLEQILLDQLAQWQTLLWYWQDIVATYTSIWDSRGNRAVRDGKEFDLPRVSEADNLERAVAMVERFHRLYMQTLKALQDQRRSPGVVVRNAKQVNLAQQQVNLS